METLETISLVCCLSMVGLLAILGLFALRSLRNFKRGLPNVFWNYEYRDWDDVFTNRRRNERW